MVSTSSNDYRTNRAWYSAVVGGKDMILRRVSALEYLELFNGYMNINNIDVYAKRRVEDENINYFLVNTFDGIDYIRLNDVLCTSVNQTINDMLRDFDTVDRQSLIEGLSCYYYSHGESFDGLLINPENIDRFNAIKDWAIEYYDEV